jgi:hypothetical protein
MEKSEKQKMIRDKSGINQKVREGSGNLFAQDNLPLQQGTVFNFTTLLKLLK